MIMILTQAICDKGPVSYSGGCILTFRLEWLSAYQVPESKEMIILTGCRGKHRQVPIGEANLGFGQQGVDESK